MFMTSKRRRVILIAICLAALLAVSNLYIGLFNTENVTTDNTLIPAPPDIKIDEPKHPRDDHDTKEPINKNTEPPQAHDDVTLKPEPTKASVNKGADEAPRREVVGNGVNNMGNIQNPDQNKKSGGGQGNAPAATCKHNPDRDYSKDPIVIGAHSFHGNWEGCDVPCVGGGGPPDASVGQFAGGDPHIKSIFFTMENVEPSAGSYDIVANTRLNSEVPLPYFNWVEYKFRRPIVEKTAKAHVAAFISNCGPQKRLQWMDAMMKAGVKIDSFGSCMRNADMPKDVLLKYGSNYNAAKKYVVSTYKFTMSFENSFTDDYVTEKLFGVLEAGSVPLVDGPSNGKMFGPSSNSMLFANDFGTPEKLAERILYLDSHDDEYQKLLDWKRVGPSDEWTALMDLGNVHSNCRLCIKTADFHRREVGPVKIGQPEGEPEPSDRNALKLMVRERGKFWLRPIYLTENTMEELKSKIDRFVPHDPKSYLFSVYELWDKAKQVKTSAQIRDLPQGTELEVIYVVPQKWDDPSFTMHLVVDQE